MVKNMESSRYKALLGIACRFRLLMTGTPVQNNLLELFSLLTFVMPAIFLERIRDYDPQRTRFLAPVEDARAPLIDVIRPLFAMAQDDQSFLSNQRIRNAQAILRPFILRRKKADVVADLPPKQQFLRHCALDASRQERRYKEEKKRGRAELASAGAAGAGKGKGNGGGGKTIQNIAMQLRKWANHPLLQRDLFGDELLREMARKIRGDPEYAETDPQTVFEDMQVMSDFELHRLCLRSRPLRRFALDEAAVLNEAGKVAPMLQLVREGIAQGEKILLFSQFTMMLDVLEAVLAHHGLRYERMDGSTAVAERQLLIDKFQGSEDGGSSGAAGDEASVFLLSTKAGGFGINLTRASTVILYDQDFNPHNDAQAEDRAHRVGQTRTVKVYRLVTRHTIEEQMYKCAQRKLELDAKMQRIDSEDAADVELALQDELADDE